MGVIPLTCQYPQRFVCYARERADDGEDCFGTMGFKTESSDVGSKGGGEDIYGQAGMGRKPLAEDNEKHGWGVGSLIEQNETTQLEGGGDSKVDKRQTQLKGKDLGINASTTVCIEAPSRRHSDLLAVYPKTDKEVTIADARYQHSLQSNNADEYQHSQNKAKGAVDLGGFNSTNEHRQRQHQEETTAPSCKSQTPHSRCAHAPDELSGAQMSVVLSAASQVEDSTTTGKNSLPGGYPGNPGNGNCFPASHSTLWPRWVPPARPQSAAEYTPQSGISPSHYVTANAGGCNTVRHAEIPF